ncbi:6-phosphogluconolactonase, partial [Streptomyces sp. NTH33]|uniref:6-phosphogluconolactonase n=1 Tax=Streptomyces sp. NTH33 TaxID=1735453 RepID=UPI0021ACCBA8
MSTPQLVVHRDKELMAQAAAARLITRIVDAQASTGSASVVLTGGRNGNGVLAALAAAPARDAIDWGRLDLWWGDERFLPEGDPERNVTQAREALLDSVPLDPKRVHAMPASDGPYGADVEAAAEAYAEELARAAGPENHGAVPTFDVLMLGVGPDTAKGGWWTAFANPAQLSFDNYSALLKNAGMTQAFWNTVLIS